MADSEIGTSLKDKDALQRYTTIANQLQYQPLALYKIKRQATKEFYKAGGLRAIKKGKIKSTILSDAMYAKDKPLDPSHVKFLIGISMYNESWDEFSYTLKAVNDNVTAFYERNAVESTSQVMCIIIVDGMRPFLQTYSKTPKKFSRFFAEEKIRKKFKVEDLMKCDFESLLKRKSSVPFSSTEEAEELLDEEDEAPSLGKAGPKQSKMYEDPERRFQRIILGEEEKEEEKIEFAHIFTISICVGKSKVPLSVVMCIKQYNKRKLNSHLWLFGGFCHEIQPDFVMLLDVGTKPLKNSLYFLHEAMVKDKDLAGCCGEIRPMDPTFWNLVVQAQVVEYKFSHMLDKALESVIGYITVLPGAFSAYRWSALQGKPLWRDYFKSIFSPPEKMDTFKSNIYLAEDRVLCLSLVSTPGKKYVLRYVKKSVAVTDVPDSLSVLLAQRRRWINGSWFALIDTLIKSKKLFGTNHNICRKFFFALLIIYYSINAFFTWFIVGMYYVAFVIAVRTKFKQDGTANLSNAGDWLVLIYTALLIIIFVTSMGVKPKKVQNFYRICSYILGILQFFVLYIIITIFVESDIGIKIMISLLAGFGTFALIIILNCEIVTILKGCLHYIFMTPTYINIFLIYSICNTHDCTWGNRPDSLSKEELDKVEDFENFRTRWANIWGISNAGFAFLALHFTSSASDVTKSYYYLGVGAIGVGTVTVRFIGGVIYWLIENCRRSNKRDRDISRSDTYEKSFHEELH